MKILTKRAIALFIDGLVFGIYYSLCHNILSNWIEYLGTVVYVILLVPLFFKDIIFRNASIGKKIMGIAIYDVNWEKPKLAILVKRAFLMLTVGYLLFWKSMFVDGEIIALFDWERNSLKTVVIEKKVLKKFQKELQEQNEDDCTKLTDMYNAYLRDLYIR